jgi:hypothetical protein
MGRPPKITGALREELWRRYKAGETVLGIGRALDQRQATIHRLLQATVTRGDLPQPFRSGARRLQKGADRPSPLAEAHAAIAARHGLRSPPR